jgi:hypothetical protein
MNPKYRAEKIGRRWYAMRGEEIISEALKTRREAESVANKQFCADWYFECRFGKVGA